MWPLTPGISNIGSQAGDEGGIRPLGSASQDPKNLPLPLQRGRWARAAPTPAREEPRLRRGLSAGGAVRRGRLPATGRRASSLPGPEAKPDAEGTPERAQMGSPTRKSETRLRSPSQTRSRECRGQEAPKQHFLRQWQGRAGQGWRAMEGWHSPRTRAVRQPPAGTRLHTALSKPAPARTQRLRWSREPCGSSRCPRQGPDVVGQPPRKGTHGPICGSKPIGPRPGHGQPG